MRLLVAACCVSMVSELPAHEEPRLGARPPNLSITPAEDSAKWSGWDELAGKTVIIEFWATWCSPCIGSLAKLNELVSSREDTMVVAISDDSLENQAKFIRKYPSIRFFSDNQEQTFQRYKALTIPHCVVVGPDGLIKAITLPHNLNADILSQIAKGEEIELPLKAGRRADVEWDFKPDIDGQMHEPTFQIIIEPTICESAGARQPPHGRSYSADGVTVETIAGAAFGLNYTRIDCQIPAKIRHQQYRVSIWVPSGKESSLGATMWEAVQKVAPVKADFHSVEKDVYVLSRDPSRTLPASTATGEGIGFSRGLLDGAGVTTKQLAFAIENFAQMPVVDETGIDFCFDAKLKYDVSDFAILENQLTQQLGLKLTKERRQVRLLFIRAE